MAVLIVLIDLMVIVYVIGSTQNTCPARVLWRRVALTTCPSNQDYYHCLERIGKDRFETVCRSPIPLTKGVYPVLDEISGNFDARECPGGTYQPINTFSWERNTCDFQKTICSEKGQITHSYSTTKEDRTCRCDYRHGYTFVQTPLNTCYCIPSQEDCSCYRETCNDSGLVNQDYNCSDLSDKDNNTTTTYTCDIIRTVLPDTEVKVKVKTVNHNEEYDITSYNIVKSDNNYRGNAASFILLLIFLYILIAGLIYIWWRYHKYKGALKIKTYRDMYTENIGGTVTLKTQVIGFGSIADFIFGQADIAEITWTKYTETTEVNVTPDFYTNEDNQYLKIEKLKFEDEAEYRCTVTNRAGHDFVSKPIKVNVLGTAGRVLLQNIPEEIKKLGKSATEEYRRLLKTEIHKQKTIHLVIIGPKESGKTSLWHNLLGIEQEEISQGLLQKYCVKIQDGKCNVTDYSKCNVNNIIKSKMKSIKTEDEKEVEVIDVIIREVPGQLEYCAALAPFVSRHAIFILTTDVNKELSTKNRIHTFSNPALERDPRFHLKESGELIRDWIYIIHSLKPAAQDSSTNLTLQPSVVLVGTHKDKFQYMKDEDLNKRNQREVYNCVYDKKSIISKHVIHSCVITNLQSQSEELQNLRDIIITGSGFAESWHDEIPVRYLWFEEILLDQRSITDVMSFDEVLQLGIDHGYPVTDKREFRSFLSHQHKVRNIIYWEDISKYVIISPSWLNGIITKLITIFQNEANAKSDYCKTGQIAVDVLNGLIKSNKEDKSAGGGQDTVDILQTFDIIVCINKKSSKHAILYVPFVIPDNHTADVVTMFEIDRRDKTSFLSFSFDFLPAALVNHIMIRLIEMYPACEVPSQNGDVAIYYRTLVLEYNPHKNQKLYFLSLKDELLFQMWIYGVQQILECFEDLRVEIEEIITKYKKRHKMNLNFKYKLKCPDSKHKATDAWDISSDKLGKTFYCNHHKTRHTDMDTAWFSGSKQIKTFEYGGPKKNLEEDYRKMVEKGAKALGLPVISVVKTEYRVKPGGSVTFDCGVISRMKMSRVSWKREVRGYNVAVDVEISLKYRGGTDRKPSLTILDVGDDDKGLYWCEVHNSIGSSESDKIKLIMESTDKVKHINIPIEKDEEKACRKNSSSSEHSETSFVSAQEERDEDKPSHFNENSSQRIQQSDSERKFQNEETMPVKKISDDDNEKAFSELDVPTNINSAQEHKGKLTDKSSDRVVTDQDEVFDAVVIHPAQDEDSATEFIDHLNSLKNDLDIPDLNVIKHKGLMVPGVLFLQSFNGLFDKARFVMIIITERFKHSRLERFFAEKTLIESLMDEDKLYRVIPISMAGQQHMPDEFIPLIAVQYYHYRASELKGKKDRTYIGTLRKMFQNGRQNYLVK